MADGLAVTDVLLSKDVVIVRVKRARLQWDAKKDGCSQVDTAACRTARTAGLGKIECERRAIRGRGLEAACGRPPGGFHTVGDGEMRAHSTSKSLSKQEFNKELSGRRQKRNQKFS